MRKVKYETRVMFIGELAQEFISENILVFFGKEAPEELTEHAIVHEVVRPVEGELEVGDTIRFDGASFAVLAVGDVVNDNLRSMGHLVVKFNGLTEPEMAGDVCVPARDLPVIEPGTVVEIVARA